MTLHLVGQFVLLTQMPTGRTVRNGEGDTLLAAEQDKFRSSLAGTGLGTDAGARGLAPRPQGR